MTGLRILSYIFLVAGVGAVGLIAFNAFGFSFKADRPVAYAIQGVEYVLRLK